MQAIKKGLYNLLIRHNAFRNSFDRKYKKERGVRLGLICEEFFHKDLRGFGGFGMTMRNLTTRFNGRNDDLRLDVLLTTDMPLQQPEIRQYHNANVLLRPSPRQRFLINARKYAKLVRKMRFNAFMTIEYYPSYEEVLMQFPTIPLVIWIKDPRDLKEWQKIATVPLERKVTGRGLSRMADLQEEKERSIKRVLNFSRKFGRKIVFAVSARSLVPIAERTYGIKINDPLLLRISVDLPNLKTLEFPDKPSLCFLGRLDPVKRPWIFFELAKRFPDVDFYAAGQTHYPDVMNPVIQSYSHVKNLKFLGHIDGEIKDGLMRKVWAFVNTSIHEALPVSFLESFAYGRPVISCQDPDGLVSKYGVYTGEILGEGREKTSIDRFAKAIERLLSPDFDKIRCGTEARAFIAEECSYQAFEEKTKKVLEDQP